jgi:K(+)-stimulated pyrophosphate-energized sodium pump
MSSTLWLIIGCGILSIVYAVWAIQSVMAADAGNARMQEIAGAIREGATAYLNRQYTTIAIVGAVVFVAAWLLLSGPAAIGFLIGAVLLPLPVSSACTFRSAPMCAPHRRLAEPGSWPRHRVQVWCRHRHAGGRPRPAWRGRLLLSANRPHGLREHLARVIDSLVALGFGASLISIFARLGGGIFTKGADVGGDLVGKVEAGIP